MACCKTFVEYVVGVGRRIAQLPGRTSRVWATFRKPRCGPDHPLRDYAGAENEHTASQGLPEKGGTDSRHGDGHGLGLVVQVGCDQPSATTISCAGKWRGCRFPAVAVEPKVPGLLLITTAAAG